ncbi:uncharacterized protein N7525_009372 [Penicillium rubens]|uniref:uncharacterized protein n=1 Tax=Penicillium rubens TaxID=1108849 RepID=UPI002A5ABF88|nr:uncharacterized protein N7525_009372 [Penicillium rubens]KAJ5831119.1 hypothetical protein N7525_009372 [Penicillium rubens]KAJ5854666.1 hypothetical protein N7534_007209 [Penicillium rubens]
MTIMLIHTRFIEAVRGSGRRKVAVSQTRKSLVQAMKFWLDEPESEVQVAISITASNRKILVERWVMGPNMPTSPDQWIEIARNPQPNSPRISGYLDIDVSDEY